MRIVIASLLLLPACTGKPDDTFVDSADSGSGDTHDTQDTGSGCTLADPTGLTALQLQGGGDYAVLYTTDDSPLMGDGYAVVVSIKGTTGYGGVPVVAPYAATGLGYLQVYVNVPDDNRGAASRAAVADTTRFAAGLEPDADGCYLADRVSVPVTASAPLLFGNSNGGNLALGALADTSLDMPDVSGIVMFETPISAQFIDVELGAVEQVNPLYVPGSCAWDPATGLGCAYSSVPTLAWDPLYQDRTGGPIGAVYIDGDGDGVKGARDYPMFGVDASDSQIAFSPRLTAMIVDQGLSGPPMLSATDADAYWAVRDGSRLAAAALDNHPGVPLISVGTVDDNFAGVSDHSHVTGAAEIWHDLGSPFVRVNPASVYMEQVGGVGPAWTDNPPNLDAFLHNPEVLMEPDEADTEVGAERYSAAALIELATRTANDDWSD